MLVRDLRTQVDVVLPRIALAERAGGLEEPLEERVVDGVLDQKAGPGQTHLSGVVVLVHGLPDDRVQVGVRECDERRLALSSSDTGVRFAPAAAATTRPVATEPVNATPIDARVPTSAAPACSPIPCTTLNAPSGSPRPGDVREHRGRERRPLRRLQHHRVPRADAGASRQLASISGAFHGVTTAATPARSTKRSAYPSWSRSPPSARR